MEAVLDDSKAQLKAVEKHKNDQQSLYDALTALSLSLVMGTEPYLRRFDSASALAILISVAEKYLNHEQNGDVMAMLFRALSLILEHVPSSYDAGQEHHKAIMKLVANTLHKALCEEWHYREAYANMLMEECLRVIRFVGRDDLTGAIIRFAFVGDLLTLCASADSLMARQALETLAMLCAKVVMPSQLERPAAGPSIFSFFKLKKKLSHSHRKQREGVSILHADNPIVVNVENVIGPFLLTLVVQYTASLESISEGWALLELALSCLGSLMERSLLCHRPSTAHTLVSKDLLLLLFRVINITEGNVVLEPCVRSDRILFCEAMLGTMVSCNRILMADCLLASEAKQFFHAILEEFKGEITTALDEPFPRGGMSARSTQRRDKDHITSIAAVRLLVLACPNVPPEAFGLKPKIVLPVHQWYWEDELRHANRLVEEQCVLLETSWARLCPSTAIMIHLKALSVDLLSMTMARGFNGGHRNISRRFVPFVYHFADFSALRPVVAVKEAGPEAVAGGDDNSESSCSSTTHHESGSSRTRRKAVSGVVMNLSAVMPASHVAIAEEYLVLLCSFATHASGQMAKQLATCACASILQMLFLSDAEQRVDALMRPIMIPMCEMLREALISADKATKAVVLTMIEWMLHHPRAASWDFCTTALRCGLLRQLDVVVTASPTAGGVGEVRLTRTASLAEKAGVLLAEANRRIRQLHPNTGTDTPAVSDTLFLAPDTARLQQAVQQLRRVNAKPGLHEPELQRIFYVLKDSTEVTPFEFYQIELAPAMLSYLVNGKAVDELDGASVVYTSGGSASTRATSRSPASKIPSTSFDAHSAWSAMTTRGAHLGDIVRMQCDEARVACFVQCGAASSVALNRLITALVGTLSIEASFPLVESIVTQSKVVCRTPLQAAQQLADVSPLVRLCGSNAAASEQSSLPSPQSPVHRPKPVRGSKGAATAAQPTAAAAAPQNPRELCLQGHRLKEVSKYIRLCRCDVCNGEVKVGYSCRICNYDICAACYASYTGNPAFRSAPAVVVPRNRAHLLASVGDIERFFRTGSSSTKGTQVAPAPQSALHHIKQFAECAVDYLRRVSDSSAGDGSNNGSTSGICSGERSKDSAQKRAVAAERATVAAKLLSSPSVLQVLLYGLLSSYYTRDILPMGALDETASVNIAALLSTAVSEGAPLNVMESVSGALSPAEVAVANQLLHDAIEERYILYLPDTGLCAFQESLLSLLYRRAFATGNKAVLLQLENCLLRQEGCNEPIAVEGVPVYVASNEDAGANVASSGPDEGAAKEFANHHLAPNQTILFHRFAKDEEAFCACGEHSRADLAAERASPLSFTLPEIALRGDMLLLTLVFSFFFSPYRRLVDTAAGDASVFASTTIATAVVKSLESSALRVCMLPPRFALPRWVSFVLNDAPFLVPRSVRERIARFVAFGAHRSFIEHMRVFRQHRVDRGIPILPAEWARLANHKFTVDRANFLHDAYRVLRKSADSRLPVSIEFAGDAGVGQGPTAQFYSLIAQALSTAGLLLWRGDEASSSPVLSSPLAVSTAGQTTTVETPPEGLFPRGAERRSASLPPDRSRCCPNADGQLILVDSTIPLADFEVEREEAARAFYILGAALGRALLDEQVLPLQLSAALSIFLRCGIPPYEVVLDAATHLDTGAEVPVDVLELPLRMASLVDKDIANSLCSLSTMDEATLDALELPFVLPGRDEFELVAGGADVKVTQQNVKRYQRRVLSALLYESVAHPLRFLLMGFRDVVPAGSLGALYVPELLGLLCGDERSAHEPLWTAAEIQSVLVGDHGYQNDSPQLEMLRNILSKRLTPAQQRAFILFCTGCPRLPHGGVRALGAITVVKRSNAFAVPEAVATDTHERSESREFDEETEGGTMALRSTSAASPEQLDNLAESSVTRETPRRTVSTISRQAATEDTMLSSVLRTDWALPSVNTCFRYLKLPPYPNEELMLEKLLLAITQSGDTFELS